MTHGTRPGTNRDYLEIGSELLEHLEHIFPEPTQTKDLPLVSIPTHPNIRGLIFFDGHTRGAFTNVHTSIRHTPRRKVARIEIPAADVALELTAENATALINDLAALLKTLNAESPT